ncbi:hypothetical protein CBW42_01735 [Butyricicoccus porcorum]|uniref:Uncharacterized protein n=1 Tax=Butyricicoccus porcorum TaxID=1945634 RepID=A0A252F6D2_9FIRM|nr:anaerobic ribonucleoside-triphosphate reductase [Butyricicoccus porcorum]MCI6927402.1 hypothetical protein [Butyricicoccus porcorum]MDD6985803.1 anaerobic ribonucleoside-triphosphate reductase [Butyricicoccus porcorum]MDY4484201.1 anaerobic ribonucleoside-triphosphate reductase [Butyricicoccus porcorum]OUM21316.1 hypothetical protein CBW42_01735 [Butyricicoccus porcorum]
MKELNHITYNANGEEMVGEGVGFERIRRITGYLVGTLDRFNNAKRAEENDRVKHDVYRKMENPQDCACRDIRHSA